ncbi:unnamed protein product [Oikopleura dioica]|uniref:Peptidase metallopeptidase domain-containing protein n=1 Tax=Oikopleura dioica TaxID=34765 RepID=E4YKG0_OIKDI|nr:unnamed protein product [Oikopleura dioica]
MEDYEIVLIILNETNLDVFCNTDRDISSHSRNRRYLESDQKWTGDKITYSILNFTPRLGRNLTRKAINSAISHWKKYLPIPIVEIVDEQWMDSADIRIKFVNSSHGDNSPFDGPGNFLAHAFYPGKDLGGDIHFDAEEPWIYRDHPQKKGNDLFLVSIHELGHALGLAHSTDPSSIMFATYQSHNTDNFQLPIDDILGKGDVVFLDSTK